MSKTDSRLSTESQATPSSNKPSSGPTTPLPLAHPNPESLQKVPARKPNSKDQEQKLTKLIERYNKDNFVLPTTLKDLKALWRKEGAGKGSWGSYFKGSGDTNELSIRLQALSPREKVYWSREQFERCLRATKWNYENAVKRCDETAVWRRDYFKHDQHAPKDSLITTVEDMPIERIRKEAETGKEIVFGYDHTSRPVLYMHPYRQNTQTGPAQIDFVVWCLERCLDLLPGSDPATEMICLCIDFGANLKVKSTPTPIGQAKKVLDILQTYYCERLGRAICINVPTFFWGFYKLVGPFVDPRTKEKIRFLDQPNATEFVPADQLQKIFGGNIDLQYDNETYLPALDKLCAERREAHFERWKLYGNDQCGLSESVIRGAITPATNSKGEKIGNGVHGKDNKEESNGEVGTRAITGVAGVASATTEPDGDETANRAVKGESEAQSEKVSSNEQQSAKRIGVGKAEPDEQTHGAAPSAAAISGGTDTSKPASQEKHPLQATGAKKEESSSNANHQQVDSQPSMDSQLPIKNVGVGKAGPIEGTPIANFLQEHSTGGNAVGAAGEAAEGGEASAAQDAKDFVDAPLASPQAVERAVDATLPHEG